MGIKKVRSCTYVSDTGQEFELSEMTSSHLLNVIAHHKKQLDGLHFTSSVVTGQMADEGRARWNDEVLDTIRVLSEELLSRHPDEEDRRLEERRNIRGY